jgi:hypothetical protein
MQDDYIECPELSGKTIQTFRIHKDTGDGTNLQIELSDGTSFSCCLNNRPDVKASLYRGGVGTPEPSETTKYRHLSIVRESVIPEMHNALPIIHWTPPPDSP